MSDLNASSMGSATTVAIDRLPCVRSLVAAATIPLTVVAPGNPESAVRSVVVAASAGDCTSGAILLAPGVDPAEVSAQKSFLEASHAGGAAAVVCKLGSTPPPQLGQLAAELDLCVLALAPEVPWDQALRDLQATLERAVTEQEERLPGVADLPSALDWVAEAAGGAAVLMDPELRVLGHSTAEFAIDELRLATVLRKDGTGEMPPGLRDELASGEIIVAKDLGRPRLLAPVISRGRLIGILSVLEGDSGLTPDARQNVRIGAAAVARHLLDERSRRHPRRPRREAVAELLDGRLDREEAARRLGCQAHAGYFLVAAVRLISTGPDDAGPLSSLLELGGGPGLVGHAIEAERATVVLAGEDPSTLEAEATELAEHLVGQLEQLFAIESTAALGTVVEHLDDLGRSRRDAMLVLLDENDERAVGRVRRASDSWAPMLLSDLATHVAGSLALAAGVGARLAELDAEKGTEYLATVRAYVDALGSRQATAEALGIHPNTVRYRVRRLQEAIGVDLDDPDERLALDLELALRDRCAA